LHILYQQGFFVQSPLAFRWTMGVWPLVTICPKTDRRTYLCRHVSSSIS